MILSTKSPAEYLYTDARNKEDFISGQNQDAVDKHLRETDFCMAALAIEAVLFDSIQLKTA